MAELDIATGELNIATGELIGTWLQLLATGAYLMYVPQCATVLWRDWKAGSSPPWLPIACALIFILTMSDLALGLVRAYQAFHVKPGERADPLTYYLDARTALDICKNVADVVLPLILDTIIVYRTYAIWDKRVAVIALPGCLVLVNLVFGALALAALPLGRVQASGLVSSSTLRYYLITTLCLNVTCSGLIWWRIWRISSGVFRLSSFSQYRSGGSVMSQVLEVLIQSAAIYCAYLLALILSSRTSLFFILVNPFPAVSAIVFCSLIVRARSTHSVSTDGLSLSMTLHLGRDLRCPSCTEAEHAGDAEPSEWHNSDVEVGRETWTRGHTS
ncbi:hypothetical protein OH76DRAFT_1490012 [Lentinus brumalis]|uniref:Uncharacterized protein n=1 Tax=Lentinus brumalis TaxID=2498619 RepID=A0A371CKI2_9APHY|nr:hypothetical protein OH76DRAFT_1490012 [Polyporus brumalis]